MVVTAVTQQLTACKVELLTRECSGVRLRALARGGAPRQCLADVWTFGAPYVLCGGDALLARLGLPRAFVRGVFMGKDLVPRSFSCYYPQLVQRVLKRAPVRPPVSSVTSYHG